MREGTRGMESFWAGNLVYISANWLISWKIPTKLTWSWMGCIIFSYSENYFEFEVNNSNFKIVIDRKIIQYLVASYPFYDLMFE